MMMSLQEIVLSGLGSLINVVIWYCSFVLGVTHSRVELVKDIKKTRDVYYSLYISIVSREWAIVDNRDHSLLRYEGYIRASDYRKELLVKGLDHKWFWFKIIVVGNQVSNALASYYMNSNHGVTMAILWLTLSVRILDKFMIDDYLVYIFSMAQLNTEYLQMGLVHDDIDTIVNGDFNDSDTSSIREADNVMDIDLDDMGFQSYDRVSLHNPLLLPTIEGTLSESTFNLDHLEHSWNDEQNLDNFEFDEESSHTGESVNWDYNNRYWDSNLPYLGFMREYVLPLIRGEDIDDIMSDYNVSEESHIEDVNLEFQSGYLDLMTDVNHLEFQSGELEFQSDDYGLSKLYIEVNQKNVRRKHFRDKKMDKNNKDMDNAKAALRFLKQAKASKSDKHKVIKAIKDTRDADPKLHKEIMKEVRGKLEFHSGFYSNFTEKMIWNEINGALEMCNTTVFQKHIEALILLILNAVQCTTWTHFMTTILAYIGSKVDNTLYSIISEYLVKLFTDEDEPLEFQSSFMDNIKNVSNMLNTGLNSKFCSKIFSFIGLLTTLSITSYLNLPFGMDAFLQYLASAIKNIAIKGDVIQQLIEHITYLYEKGIMFFKTKDLNMVFYDIEDANAYQLEYSDLKAYEYLLDAGCLEQFGVSIASYSKRIDEMVIKTDYMLKGCKDDRTRAFIGAKKQSMLTLKFKLLVAFRKMTMRIKPYTVLLSGESGVGKTVAKDLLIQVIAGSNPDYFTVEDMIVSSINDDDQYMTEATNQTQVLVVDDAGNTQPMYAEKAITKTVIHASNNEPKAIIKAKLEEKGAHYMNFNCIMMTTNKPDLHTKSYTVDPTSVLRRFEVIITVRIKDEYRKTGSYMLDVNKTEGMEMDIWEFCVTRAYKCVEDKSTKYDIPRDQDNVLMECVDINTLLRFLSWDSQKHFARQKSLMTEHATIRKMKVCPHGSLVSICKEESCSMQFQAGTSFMLKFGLGLCDHFHAI